MEAPQARLAPDHPLGRQGGVARLLPQSLTHRVGGRLPRPAQVAVELKAQEGLAHGHVVAQEGPGGGRVPPARSHAGQVGQLGGPLLAQVHANVQDHARGAQALGVQHAHTVTGVVLEPQVGHEALGVQGPALAVTAHPAAQAPPGVEGVTQVGLRPHLEVVARHALVEDGGALLPGGEVRGARGDRPPHASRAREVVAGARVVDAARGRRGDPALQGPQRLGDVEVDAVEGLDGGVGGLLHPGLEGVGAVDPPGGVGVQAPQGLTHARARPVEALGDRPLLGVNGRQPRPPPLVGLVQVHPCTQEAAAEQLVALPSDGVVLTGQRQDLAFQEGGEGVVGRPGPGCGAGELTGQGLGHRRGLLALADLRVGQQRLEGGLLAGLGAGLPHDGLDLPTGGHLAAGGRQEQGVLVARQGPGHVTQGGGQVPPVLGGGRGQQVEDVAQALGG